MGPQGLLVRGLGTTHSQPEGRRVPAPSGDRAGTPGFMYHSPSSPPLLHFKSPCICPTFSLLQAIPPEFITPTSMSTLRPHIHLPPPTTPRGKETSAQVAEPDPHRPLHPSPWRSSWIPSGEGARGQDVYFRGQIGIRGGAGRHYLVLREIKPKSCLRVGVGWQGKKGRSLLSSCSWSSSGDGPSCPLRAEKMLSPPPPHGALQGQGHS